MDFNGDWFMRSIEMLSEGVARKVLGKPEHTEYVEELPGGDDPFWWQLRALLAKRDFCAAEDLLWESLRPGDPACLPLAEEFYRLLGKVDDEALEAHGFSRTEVAEGLERAKEYLREE
ncbi:MAG: DUF6483 family protein [Oscillospiraceae bacterium]|nr:DUF6483 family protein [Oscillospiraceae bacterium]